MSIEFKLPELGENIEDGDIVHVLVSEGDTIAANDGVFEIETEKAVVEIPCPHAGKVTQIHVEAGETVRVGQVLLTIEPEDSEPEEAPPVKEEKSDEPEEPPREQPRPEPAAKEKEKPTPPAKTPPRREEPSAGTIPAGPAARRLARELDVDLSRVQGSGKRGRITREDVEAAAGEAEPSGPAAVTPPGEPDQDPWGPIRRDRLSKIRQTIAAQMAKSAATIPHVTNFDDADVTDLESLRKGLPRDYLGEGVRLTTMPFVIKAVAMALKQHPLVNASLDEENNQIVYKEYVNVGIAVDTPRGLVVPAMRNVDRLPIARIARELTLLAERARDAQFTLEELRGGTFTISNLGAVGGMYSTPIINHPEVAILRVGRSRSMPVVREGAIEPRIMMPLSLSYDHRLVDGAAAGRFLNDVIDFLQSPAKLLLAV